MLVSGLQKFGIITILVSSCSLALAQATAPESTAQGRSPADADDQQLGRVTVTGYIVPRIGEGPVINVGNVASDPRYLSAFGSTRSEMIVPILDVGRAKVVGTIDVESEQANAFDRETEKFLVACAGVISPLWM